MHAYWLTYRLASTGRFAERQERLTRAIGLKAEGMIWQQPTSFMLFRSKLNIDTLARHLKKAIDPTEDVLLLAMPNNKDARLIGALIDHSIYSFFPHIRDV